MSLPGVLQPKLAVGEVDDPLEREANSVADQVMRCVPMRVPAISAAAPQISRNCAGPENATERGFCRRTGRRRGAGRSAPGAGADRAVARCRHSRLLRASLRKGTRACPPARRHTRPPSLRAPSALVPTRWAQDVVFADTVDTASDGGRRLLAHELTHTIQQLEGTAARQTQHLQRQMLGTSDPEEQKDPDCPPKTPCLSLGTKARPDGNDPAVVSPCMAVPMPRSRPNPLDPETTPDQPAPTSETPSAAPPPTQPDQQPTPVSGETTTDQPAGSDGDGYDFDDDPLADDGFAPGDTSIRVRPEPVRTTFIPPRPVAPTAAPVCSFEMHQIAAFGGSAGPMDLAKLAKDVTDAFAGCEIAFVGIDVVPNATLDDPTPSALERAESIKQQLIQAIGPGKFSEDRFDAGLSSGEPGDPEVSVWIGGRSQSGRGGTAPHPPAARRAATRAFRTAYRRASVMFSTCSRRLQQPIAH